MITTVIDTINKYKMLEHGDKVTVALSGGADSVCLLLALCEIKDRFEISVEAVHINHCIRGEESDRDENFCIALCERLNVPLNVYRIDVLKAAENSGKSLEETARDKRYEKFSECSRGCKVATAHTLSDSWETVIFNLIRGTGLKGLCGIPPVRDNIIRPLIDVTRQQAEDYLKEKKQDFVTDSTNLSDDYARNKIRHNIMPVIMEINKGFYKSFANCQRALREENDFLEMQADEIYKKCCVDNILSGISDYPSALKKRIISKFLNKNNLPVNSDKINQIADLTEKNGKINIIRDTFVIGNNGRIFLEKKSLMHEEKEIFLKIGNNSIFDNINFKAEITSKYEKNINLVDLDKISGKIILRNRRFGDKIQLAGRNFTSSVKKLINENIPYEKRKFIHFLCDDDGLIFMEGFGASDRVKPGEASENILKITIEGRVNE